MNFTTNERRILLVTCFAHFLSHFNLLVFPALVLPLASAMGMDMAKVLGLSFWGYLLFGVSALPWGLAGDRWGGKPLMMMMFLGAGIGGTAAALFAYSPTGVELSLAMIGLFSGVYHPIGLGLISKGISSRMSMAMGYNAAMGGLGMVAAPLAAGLSNYLIGPRAAFMTIGALNLAGLAMMALLPLQEPEHRESVKTEKGNGMLGGFLILLVAMMLGGVAYTGATVILPAYLELKNQGLLASLSGLFGTELSSNLVATTVTSIIFVVGMLGQYFGGHVGERFEHRYAYLVFHALCIPFAFLMARTVDVTLVFMAFIYFFCLLGMQPVENTLVAGLTPKRLHHSAFGMKFILTFGVGSLAVKMMQWIETNWGVDASFTALGAVSVLITITIVVLILKTSPQRTAAPEPVEEAESRALT